MPLPNPSKLGLPVPDWRVYQEDTIIAAVSSDKPVILLQAPTGSGKSVVAVAISRLLGAQRSAIVCHNLALQDQYARDFPEAALLKGRANFPCLIQDSDASEAPCTIAGPNDCAALGRCPYYAQKRRAENSALVVTNYAYYFTSPMFAIRPLDLQILDEAHVIEEGPLLNAVEVRLSKHTFKRAEVEWPRIDKADWEGWRRWATQTLRSLPSTSDVDFRTLTRREVVAIRAVEAVAERCLRLKVLDADWKVREDPFGITFQPIWVAEYGRDLILKRGKKTIFMSATFLDPAIFCEGLGLTASQVHLVDVPSTFPRDRRPIFVRPLVNVNHRMAEADKRLLVDEVDAILDDHRKDRGLIHSGNYALAEYIKANSRHQARLVTHQTKNRADVISWFRTAPGPNVLISPSMTEGVDFPHDLCRFIVVAKLPFPSLEDERIKARMKQVKNPETGEWEKNPRGSRWYQWLTTCTLVQSFGRGMRSADDSCKTYILDSNTRWFLKAVRRMLPEWVKEALIEEGVPQRTIEMDRQRMLEQWRLDNGLDPGS